MKSYRISEARLGRAPTMAKSRNEFAVHPGEILKTEFMEPMGLSAYELALNFPGIYDVVRGDRALPVDTAIRLGKYFGLAAQFWLNLQNEYDLRIVEGRGIGKGFGPAKLPMMLKVPTRARVSLCVRFWRLQP
jgi:antitoxin HigA-1